MGKRIVITGAGQGLGRAIARRFAAEGHSLILLGRTASKVEAAAAELGGDAYGLGCDVGASASVNAAFEAIRTRSGGIDMLINNAAIYQPSMVRDITDAQIVAAVTTNLSGPIHCARAAIPLMERGGHIINISSESVTLPHAMFALYQSSKAGLERFSKALHDELEEEGIRVTMVRAGQMQAEGADLGIDMETRIRFVQENMKRGLNLRERPISPVDNVASIFSTLANLPADVNIPELVIEARHP